MLRIHRVLGPSKIFANRQGGVHCHTPVRHYYLQGALEWTWPLTMVKRQGHNACILSLEGLGSKATWEEHSAAVVGALQSGCSFCRWVGTFRCGLGKDEVTCPLLSPHSLFAEYLRVGCVCLTSSLIFFMDDQFPENEKRLQQWSIDFLIISLC